MKNEKIWTKDFLMIAAINLIIYFVYYLLIVTITVYAMDELGASASSAGLAAGIFIIGALFSRIFAGNAIGRFKRKTMLYTGMAALLVTTALYFTVQDLGLLLIVRFLQGAAFGWAGTAAGTIVAYIIPDNRYGEGLSYYTLSTTLASAVGPYIGMLLTNVGNFRVTLLLAVITASVGVIVMFFIDVPEMSSVQGTDSRQKENTALEEDNVGTHEEKKFRLTDFFEPKAVPIAVVSIFVGLAFSSILGFFNSYTAELNLAGAGSFFFAAYAVSILIFRPIMGRQFDRRGENFVMYPSFIVYAVGMAVIGLANSGFLLILGGVIIGIGYGTILSSMQAIAVKSAPEDRKGLATSTFFSFIDGGAGIGPFLLGFIVPVLGYSRLYLATAALVLGCVVLYYFLHGRKTKKRFTKDNRKSFANDT